MPTPCNQEDNGIAAIGTRLEMLDTSVSPQAWVQIAKVTDINGPQGKTSEIDVTTMDSGTLASGGGFNRYIGSLKDSGTVTTDLVWDPNDPTHAGLSYKSIKQAWDDALTRRWRIVYPSSPEQETIFCGFVNSYVPMAKVKDALRCSIGIRVTGGFDVQLASIDDIP